jgi:hypothetical protein
MPHTKPGVSEGLKCVVVGAIYGFALGFLVGFIFKLALR